MATPAAPPAKTDRYSLTTPEKVAEYLKKATMSGQEMAFLADATNAVSRWCEAYCGREFRSRARTHDGANGNHPLIWVGEPTNELWLPRVRPITQVSSLIPYPNATALTEYDGQSGDYIIHHEEGYIEWRTGIFSPTFPISLTYTGGYVDGTISDRPYDPSWHWGAHGDLELSVVKQVAEMYHRRARQKDGFESYSTEGGTFSLATDPILGDVEAVWRSYRGPRV